MKGKFLIIIFSFLMIFSFVFLQEAHGILITKEKVIITYHNNIDEQIILDVNGEIIKKMDNFPIVLAYVPTESIKTLRNNELIKSVEHNIIVKMLQVPPQSQDWGIEKVYAPNAWQQDYTGKNVKVAVIDTGIDLEHPDLVVSGGISTIDGHASYDDDEGHGTHVAGIIGAKNNSIGTIGVAPDSLLYSVKVLNSAGSGTLFDIIEGIDWSVSNEMDIINMSLGINPAYLNGSDLDAFQTAVDTAYTNGIIIVAASGNEGPNTSNYPALFETVISVGATDVNNNIANFSSTNPSVEVSAPGVNIKSAYPIDIDYDGVNSLNGTSMASPYVAGVLALMVEANPEATNVQHRTTLAANSLDLGVSGRDDAFGHGLVRFPSDFTPPSVPQGITGSITDSTISISWNAVSDTDLAGYFVYVNGNKVNEVPTQNLSYTISNLQNGTHYDVNITAADTTGNESAFSITFSGTPKDNNAPSNITELSTQIDGDKLSMNWTNPIDSDFVNVNVYKNDTLLNRVEIIKEDFEDITYIYSFNGDWNRTNSNKKDGSYSFTNADITDNQTSSVTFTTIISSEISKAFLSFDWSVSSEENYDIFKVYVNNVEVLQGSGEVPWSNFEHELTTGENTIRLEYSKDSSQLSGLDAVFVDNLNILHHKTPKIVPLEETTIFEDFEDTTHQFDFVGDWLNSDAKFKNGVLSYSNANISHGQNSISTFDFTIPSNISNAYISFDYATSTETNYDYLNVYINDEQVIRSSGENDWINYSKNLSPGTYNVKFEYIKDSSQDAYLDSVFIDNLNISYSDNTSTKGSYSDTIIETNYSYFYTLKSVDTSGNESSGVEFHIGANTEGFPKQINLKDDTNIYNRHDFNTKVSSVKATKVTALAEYNGWYKINTWLGEKWVYKPETFPYKLALSDVTDIFNEPSLTTKVSSIKPTTVTVIGEHEDWLLIKTWLGPKWIINPTGFPMKLTLPTITYIYDEANLNTYRTAVKPTTVNAVTKVGDWYQIETWLGLKWIQDPNVFPKKVLIETNFNLYNEPDEATKISTAKPTTVTVVNQKGHWLQIETWLGLKWAKSPDYFPNYITLTQITYLYTDPNLDTYRTAIKPATIKVLSKNGDWYEINTWLGPLWMQNPENFPKYVKIDTIFDIYNEPNLDTKITSAKPTSVKVLNQKGYWYQIETWLGAKWTPVP